jgi:hypothetical protein
MTPNWDDPAIAAGANPTLPSDRYALALIFLRVVGAAHFPIQRRQREGRSLDVDFGLPAAARRARSLRADAPIWDLCARGLSTLDPPARPDAGAWVSALEEILDELGAMSQVRAVWAAQGGGQPAPSPASPGEAVSDVTVRPVEVVATVKRWERINPTAGGIAGRPAVPGTAPARSGVPVGPAAPVGPAVAVAFARSGGPGPLGGSVAGAAPPPPSIVALAREGARQGGRLWLDLHTSTAAALSRQGRRSQGATRVVACVVVDVVLLAVTFFVVAMVVSILLGI